MKDKSSKPFCKSFCKCNVRDTGDCMSNYAFYGFAVSCVIKHLKDLDLLPPLNYTKLLDKPSLPSQAMRNN